MRVTPSKGEGSMWKKEASTGDDTAQNVGQDAPANGQGEADVIAFVGKGVEFKGVITYDGTVRIDGQLDGEIHTEGILVVGEEAVITAKVSAGTIVCKGRITGDIVAAEKVKLLAPAVLNGSVKTPMLSMEEGVLFNGSSEMARADVRELPRDTRDIGRESVMRAVNAQGAPIKRLSV
jgi:cytoskeletal protein CcmA (bactofilin family)